MSNVWPLHEQMYERDGLLFSPSPGIQMYRKGREVNCRKAAREGGLGREPTMKRAASAPFGSTPSETNKL